MKVLSRLLTLWRTVFLENRIDNRKMNDYITAKMIKVIKSDRRNDHVFFEPTRNSDPKS